jgi:outer membrane receptor protein involved in Fe transport
MVSKFAAVSRIALFAGALALGGGAALAQTSAAPAPAPSAAAPAVTQAAPAAPKADVGKVETGKTDHKPAAANAGKSGAAVSHDKDKHQPTAAAGQKAEAGKTDAKPGAVDTKKADGKSTTMDKNAAPATEGSSTAKKL